MAIEFGSKEAQRVLRRAYLKENKQAEIGELKSIYKQIAGLKGEIANANHQIELLNSEAATLRRLHGITVEDEMMMM